MTKIMKKIKLFVLFCLILTGVGQCTGYYVEGLGDRPFVTITSSCTGDVCP